jgi:mRNA interferase MazF
LPDSMRTAMVISMIEPKRGEIWEVDFYNQAGQEIQKLRPALVVSHDEIGRIGLRIVVPVTGRKKEHDQIAWLVRIDPDSSNGLTKRSSLDASQVKSVSVERFQNHIGRIKDAQVDEVIKAIRLCIE